jgi:competence protein ComFC
MTRSCGEDITPDPTRDAVLDHRPATLPTRRGHALRKLGQVLVQTVLPETCAGCDVSGTWLCDDCSTRTRRIDQSTACPCCGTPCDPRQRSCRECSTAHTTLTTLHSCRSAYEHHGPVRDAIHRLKYGGEYARAEWCAEELEGLLHALRWQADVLVPVPLHPQRLRERGYNQSERIAHHLARTIGTTDDGLLLRSRFVRPQVGLNADERRENVAGAFAATRSIAGASIILIDDVVTTGSTLNACAQALRDAGASEVRALTVAREMP